MVVHLLTNASVNNGVETFQNSVYMIHGLGKVLWIVEWVFIFIPLLFHAIFGVIIVQSGLPNHNSYRYTNNVRYSLQRATGMIAFLFIMWHVFQMHGWFHWGPWVDNIVTPLGGGTFRAYNAASTARRWGAALSARTTRPPPRPRRCKARSSSRSSTSSA
jgi:succinate dehydrogenase / fumarate reductase, cytochrome b subunit